MFENFCKMSTSDFKLIGSYLTKHKTYLGKCVPAKDRFTIILSFWQAVIAIKSLYFKLYSNF